MLIFTVMLLASLVNANDLVDWKPLPEAEKRPQALSPRLQQPLKRLLNLSQQIRSAASVMPPTG